MFQVKQSHNVTPIKYELWWVVHVDKNHNIASIHVVEGSQVTTTQQAYLKTATYNNTTTKHHFVAVTLFDFSFHQYMKKLKTEGELWKTMHYNV